MKSRTVFILNDFGYVNGGASQVALSSAMGLARAGWRVIFFAAVPPVLPELEEHGIEVLCANQPELIQDPIRLRSAINGLWNYRVHQMVSAALDRLEKSRTIVHLHSWTKALSASAVHAVLRKDFRVVCTLHDYFTVCPNGGFYNYQTNQTCPLVPLSVACILRNCDVRNYPHKLWRVARQFIQQKAVGFPGKINHFIFVSNYSREILKSFMPHAHWYHVPNPVVTDKRNPVAAWANRRFTMVGRLSKEKGALLLVQAALKVGSEALFVGDGECRKEILRANPHAQITGWVDRKTVDDHLATTRVLIFPSLLYETQGLSVLEAASRGIPAIVSDTTAAREFVADGATGSWFRGGDVYNLIQKMDMMKNDDLVRSLGLSAYERYWFSPFSLERHVTNLFDVYEEILNR